MFHDSERAGVYSWCNVLRGLSASCECIRQDYRILRGLVRSIRYTYESVRKQDNTVDCGSYAIVFAYGLAVDGGVCSSCDGEELRRWTEVCIEGREISVPQRRPELHAERVNIPEGGNITKQWFDRYSTDRLIRQAREMGRNSLQILL